MQNNVFYKHIGDYFMIKRHKLIGFAAVAAFFLLLSCKNNLSPEIPVEDIIISPHNEGEISIVSGMSKNITVKIIPENATNKTLAYSSTPGEVAAIDSYGSIRARKVGNAVIKITAADGVQKTIKVTVTAEQIPVEDIEVPSDLPKKLYIGEDPLKLADLIKAKPDTATEKGLTYTASNDNVQITKDGTITAVKDGAVNITVKSKSTPSVIKKITITVKQKPEIKIEVKKYDIDSDSVHATFKVQTLHDKLEYTPVVVGSGAKWLKVDGKNNTNPAEDEVILTVKKNKTIWERTAYVKFKGPDGKYIKGSDNEELQVKLTQKENKNPNVRIKWVHGITPPTDSEKKKVEIPRSNPTEYHKMPYVFYWYETEHTKFFNTRKMSPTGSADQGFPDGSQCWAKSSSNMLHWWFEQNKENVEKYIAKKGITKENNPARYEMYNPVYTRGLPDTDENIKSSIANEFRKKCPNSTNGNWIYSGLRWYLYGLKGLAKDKTYSPALFKDVFGKGEENDPVVAEGTYTKKIFEDILKDALLNPNSKKAVGVHVHDEGKYGHGITLWGAAFDDEENVIAIYVCDNNFKPNRIFTYGIYYKGDIYADDPEGQTNVYPYLINYTINQKINRYVGTLVTLDLGEAQWKEWLDKNK